MPNKAPLQLDPVPTHHRVDWEHLSSTCTSTMRLSPLAMYLAMSTLPEMRGHSRYLKEFGTAPLNLLFVSTTRTASSSCNRETPSNQHIDWQQQNSLGTFAHDMHH